MAVVEKQGPAVTCTIEELAISIAKDRGLLPEEGEVIDVKAEEG